MTRRRAALAAVLLLVLLVLHGEPPRRPPPLLPQFVAGWDAVAPTLPGRNEGRLGRPGDPLNLVFVGGPATLSLALKSAGWTPVPRAIGASVLAGLKELLAGRTLAAFPPMNDYRLIGRLQDMNWAMPVRGISERHHFRLWLTGDINADGRPFWWGSANYDRGIRWLDLSHRPDPDADKERDFIIQSLSHSPLVETVVLVPLPRIPREGVNDKGYPFRTDGRAAVIVLRPRTALSRRAAASGAPSATGRAARARARSPRGPGPARRTERPSRGSSPASSPRPPAPPPAR
jgi:hypothetical protein